MGNFARYLPHTPEDIRRMLETINVKRVEDLFETIPAKYRLSKSMNLPEPLGEPDLLSHLQELRGSIESPAAR